jgi:hypothetical protein
MMKGKSPGIQYRLVSPGFFAHEHCACLSDHKSFASISSHVVVRQQILITYLQMRHIS